MSTKIASPGNALDDSGRINGALLKTLGLRSGKFVRADKRYNRGKSGNKPSSQFNLETRARSRIR